MESVAVSLVPDRLNSSAESLESEEGSCDPIYEPVHTRLASARKESCVRTRLSELPGSELESETVPRASDRRSLAALSSLAGRREKGQREGFSFRH